MQSEAAEEVDFKDLLGILWRQKWIILAFVALSQALAVWKYHQSPDRYLAESKFIFKSAPTESPFSNIAAMMGIRQAGGQGANNLSNFFDILLYTDDFLRPIIERSWKVGGDSLPLAKVWKLKGIDTSYRAFRAQIGWLQKYDYIKVKKDSKTGVITLETRFEKPDLAYEVNLYIMDQLNDYLLSQTRSQESENRKFIEKRLAEVSEELRNTEDALLNFNIRNKSISSPELVLQSARLRRAVEINQEIYLQLKKELEMAKINERKETPVVEVIARPEFPLGPEPRLGTKYYLAVSLGGTLLGIFIAVIGYFLVPSLRRHRP